MNMSIGSRRGSDACHYRMPTGRDGRSDDEGQRSSIWERSYWDQVLCKELQMIACASSYTLLEHVSSDRRFPLSP